MLAELRATLADARANGDLVVVRALPDAAGASSHELAADLGAAADWLANDLE